MNVLMVKLFRSTCEVHIVISSLSSMFRFAVRWAPTISEGSYCIPAFRYSLMMGASGFLTIRASDAEREAYQDAADSAEKRLSEWVRETLNKAAKRESKRD